MPLIVAGVQGRCPAHSGGAFSCARKMGGMKSHPAFQCVLAAVALLLVSIFVYGAGYLWLGTEYRWSVRDKTRLRIYDHWWMVKVFAPAARLESMLTGEEVRAAAEVAPNCLQTSD